MRLAGAPRSSELGDGAVDVRTVIFYREGARARGEVEAT